MRIIVDAMGGDNAPSEIVRGAAAAARNADIEIVLTGRKSEIEKAASESGVSCGDFEIADCPDVVEMEDDPVAVIRKKPESSMIKGLSMLASGKADGFVSAGSTGALLTGATLIVKRVAGVKRAALAPVLPAMNDRRFMLVDCGANVECKPEHLLQFAQLGSLYMSEVEHVENPLVGLCNIGTESTKGGDLQREALALLAQSGLNFAGNVEARGLPLGEVSVAVCDGFTGNMILKTIEGMGKFMGAELKNIFMKNVLSKAAALLVKDSIAQFKSKMSSDKVGGTPFIGIKKPVVKAHGSSKAAAVEAAVMRAAEVASSDFSAKLEHSFKK